jgi:glycosyltransferase involved in cell wall biosynthesis
MSPSRPTPVLYLSATDAVGGAELSLLALLRHLDRSRVQPTMALPVRAAAGETHSLAAALGRLEVPAASLSAPALDRSRNPFTMLRQWLALRRAGQAVADLARETGAELIHANTSRAALLAAFLPPEAPPLLWHHRDLRLPAPAGRALGRAAAAAVAVSEAVAASLHRWLPPDRVHVIPSGVELGPYEELPPRAEARAALELPAAGPLLLAVGHFAAWKRHDLFLDTLARLREELPGARGFIAGGAPRAAPGAPRTDDDGPAPRAALQEAIDERALGDAVRVADLPPERMPALYAAADLLLHLAEAEPFGRAVVEALAAGLPVVAAERAGPAEILGAETGLTVPPGDVRAAAAACRNLLEDDGFRAERTARARPTARRYDAARLAPRYHDLYDALAVRGA